MGPSRSCIAALWVVVIGGATAQQAPPAQPGKPQEALWSDTKPGPTPLKAEEPAASLTPDKRGDIYMARKMYREAIDAYREALAPREPDLRQRRPDPQLAREASILYNKIGIAYHQMTELEVAKKHYEQALKLNKNYSEAINNLGAVYYAKKSYRRAVGQYKKALKLSPQSASIYSNLGTAHFARRKYKDAMGAYQQALALDPDVFEHRSSYGVLLQERSVEERAKFHFYLAKTYAQAGMVDRALLYMRKALEEGFKDRNKFLEDPEFATVRDLPEFQQLMALEPKVL